MAVETGRTKQSFKRGLSTRHLSARPGALPGSFCYVKSGQLQRVVANGLPYCVSGIFSFSFK
jgi:hypothetical protein